MLSQIPCHLIGGPLGAGKTSLLQALLAQKPANESWALLINEFGAIGLDAALLQQEQSGVVITEVAGGCLCCINGAPFQVGLSRLLRKAKPQRLFIETSGLGHPLALAKQLRQPPWQGVLQLQPLLMVLDAQALEQGRRLSAEQLSAAEQAGLLLLNKSAALSLRQREKITDALPKQPIFWSEHGYLALTQLPCSAPSMAQAELPSDSHSSPLSTLWQSPDTPIWQIQDQPEGWAIGWRWHPSQRFDRQRLADWLGQQNWQRAKLIIQHDDTASALNSVAGQPLDWQTSAWRRDSRIELIFAEPQSVATLQQSLRNCLVQI